jgi:cell shape-determining protein MreC
MSVKLGEVQAKICGDVRKTDELFINLRVGNSDKLEIAKLKPSEDLKKGDTVKITIEKM